MTSGGGGGGETLGDVARACAVGARFEMGLRGEATTGERARHEGRGAAGASLVDSSRKIPPIAFDVVFQFINFTGEC